MPSPSPSPSTSTETVNPLWGDDWPQVRHLWSLDWSVAHVNHGSFGAVPLRTQAYQHELRDRVERNPDAWVRGLTERVGQARRALAGCCGADEDGFALVPNASAGTTVALAALPVRPGQQVVVTDHGYGAVRYAVERACTAAGARMATVHVPLGADDAAVVEALAGAVTSGATAAVVVDHITSPTAKLMPVAAIVAAVGDVPVVVDGAHATAMLDRPAAGLGAAFWTGNFHKWYCAPRGVAGLAVSGRWRDRVRPLIASWGEPDPFPGNFDQQGTLDYTGPLAAPQSGEVLASLRWDRLREHNRRLVEYGQQVVCSALGAPLPTVGVPAPSMRLVPLPAGVAAGQEQAAALQAELGRSAGCEVAVTSWDGRGFLRLSAHAYNCPADYERLATAVRHLLAG